MRAVLFDYGGVLAHEGFFHGLAAVAGELGLDADEARQAGYDCIWGVGYVLGSGTERDFWDAFKHRLGISADEDWMRRTILSRFILRPWMLDLVRFLRGQGLVTGILSDQTDWLARLDARDGFFHLFDHVMNSYHYGLSKKETAYFELAAGVLGLDPADIVFIDDVEGNVSRARQVGFQAVLYVDKPQFEATARELFPGWPSAS